MTTDFYKKIKRLQNDKGIRTADLVKGSGISHATLSRWKSGERSPKLSTLVKLAKFFDVDVGYFAESNVIIDRMAEQNYSFKELAKKLNVPVETIYRWTNSPRSIDIQHLKRIGKVLNFTDDDYISLITVKK